MDAGPKDNGGFPPGTPWWIRMVFLYGPFFFLVMYLLGALDGVPGVKSPITRLVDAIKETTVIQVQATKELEGAAKKLQEAVDDERQSSAVDRETMIKELRGLRDDLYATRPSGLAPLPARKH